MNERQDLARRISQASQLTGRFRLRSGEYSDLYFDKYRFESDPELLGEIANGMRNLVPPETDVLAGLELGGVPVCTALSLLTGIRAAYVRKSAKDYGTMNLCEGAVIKGKKVCVIEDIISTGGQVLESIGHLQDLGADVIAVCCVIRRSGFEQGALHASSIPVRALFGQDELIS